MGPDFWARQFSNFIYALATHGHVIVLGTLAITVFGLGPIGRALAARIRGGPALPQDDPTVGALKAGISDVQERLDFSERVLAELRQQRLGSGKGASPAGP